MPQYTTPLKDLAFVLHDVLKVEHQDIPGYSEIVPDLTSAIFEEAGKLASNVFTPLNQVGDQQGCRIENGSVIVPEGFKEAYDQFCEGGWSSLDIPEEFGGQNLPTVINMATTEIFTSANQSLTMYPGLTHGAWSAIYTHGSEEQKQTYLHKMATGEWSGTMNLTEPHCGTDLGMLKTKAVPQADGTHKISGSKIFISCGEHELTKNIIHLVLARLPDAPEGIKGISLFIVPKFHVNADGSLGDRNGVTVGSLEHKMGIHGNATCVMNYDDATGYLVGEPNKGLAAMFTMMNEARIGTGIQGYAVAVAAYQNAVAYALERIQGRSVTGPKNAQGPADPIIVHPDIRRTLMDQRSFVEGARVFSLWLATLVDRDHRCSDESAGDTLALLTPVLKAFLTDKGYEAATCAQQVLGGHGYVEEWGMSQYVRDSRIAMIYEGANGIQALDLVGRKLGAKGGKPVMAFGMMVKNFAESVAENPELGELVTKPLLAALTDFQTACQYLMENGSQNPDAALSGSTDFLHLVGHLCFGYVFGLSAVAAQQALAEGKGDKAFYEQKMLTVKHYLTRHLPMTRMHLKRIQTGSETVMGPTAEAFAI